MDGDVRRGADDEVHRRRAGQAVFLDVPSGAAQHAVTRRGQRGEVGHLSAGDEADAGRARQVEELEQPFAGDVLDDRGRGRGGVDAGVLIPGAGQPVGRERDRKTAADDEAEVARTGAGDEAAVGAARKRVDDGGGIFAVVGQRSMQRGEELLARGLRADVAIGKIAQKGGGAVAGEIE